MTGTWTSSGSGTSSMSGPERTSATTRCPLYDGSSSTRQAGRQSLSQQQTSSSGSYCSTSREMKSMNPRTALTGVPSSAVISGTPKKARKYIEAESRSINLGPDLVTTASCQSVRLRCPRDVLHHRGHRPADPPAAGGRRPDVLHRPREGDRAVHLGGAPARQAA